MKKPAIKKTENNDAKCQRHAPPANTECNYNSFYVFNFQQ